MLSGFRVLDLCDESGSLAGKILAELGADVIRIEPPGGDLASRRPPYLGDRPDPEGSLPWLALQASKRGITLDLESEPDRKSFLRLASGADVLLESAAPGWMDARGIGWEALRRSNPRLVYCSITPFGRDGPYCGFRASDLVVVAMGGNAALTGDPDRAPLRCTLPTSHFHGGPEAALGIVMALFGREQSGRGQLVDVSLQECQLATLVGGPGRHALGMQPLRRTGVRTGRTREIWPTRDGHVSFGLRGGPARIPNLVATVELMAECDMAPSWLREVDWSQYDPNRLTDAEIERFESAFGAFFRSRTMRELYEEALARRILLAPCNDAREVVEHVQLRERDFFTAVEYPELGTVIQHPARFASSSRHRIGLRSRAPRVGEHQDEVLRELENTCPQPISTPPEAAPPPGIFRGLKMLEFGSGAAGPLATRYFAEQGATVVRVESARRPDFLRLLHAGGSDPSALDAAPMFLLLNPDKRSVTLNLARPEAAALARRLVEWSDVVSENFAPGVMARWGLDYGSLRPSKPELIMLSGCLFGQTGPQRGYPGFGGQGSAIAGFNHLTGWPDREAIGPYGTITDTLSPRYAAVLIAAALLERERCGRGQYFDLSQIETGVYSLAEMVLRYSANGDVAGRLGNHDPQGAPHAIYPCRGEDRWIAIAVFSEAEWQALVDAMGRPAWAREERFASAQARLRHQEALDRRLAGWTARLEPYALMQRLQDAGVRAGVVQSCADLLRDPQLAHRGHFRALPHARLGELWLEHSGFRLSESPPVLSRPGPRLGEHNAEVLGGILGLDADEIARLVAEEVVI